MKVLDVQFYSQVSNPDGIPTDWPAKCVEIDDALPVTPSHTRMTLAQFAAYRAARQAAYDAWESTTYAAAKAARERDALRTAAKDYLLNDPSPTMKAHRAGTLLTVDEVNALRQWMMAFKAAVAASTSLANMQTRVAALADLPDRTPIQALNAEAAKVTAGSAD